MEKVLVSFLLLFSLTMITGCANEPAKDDKSSRELPDLVLSGYSASTGFPASYTGNDGTTVSFTVNIANNGGAIAASSEYLMIFLCVTNVSGLNKLSAFCGPSGLICPYYSYYIGGNSGYKKGWTGSGPFSSVNISTKGTTGANYFYLVAAAMDSSGWIDDQNDADNIYQINATAITKN